MYYCENCSWEGKELKKLVNLDRKQIEEFEGCPQCHSDNISILEATEKEKIITTIKRHLKGIEKAVEKLEKGVKDE